MEKSLPIATEHYAPKTAPRNNAIRVIVLTCLTFILCITWFSHLLPEFTGGSKHDHHEKKQKACQQVPALFPSEQTDKLKQAYDFLFTDQFQNASIARLSGAVQIHTESFDDLGKIGEDERWDVFYPFHEYLAKTFPRIHSQLKVEKVNTHGLVYTWTGSDEKRKPIVLMAHQDTVPVDRDTIDSWTHPPWSGYYDGEKIWGRGSSDCKNSLIGILETLEILLEAEYTPSRTIVLSFGFDEECSGREGAGHLSDFLLERYGDNGVAAIVDEGMGWQKAFGRGYATPGVAEKGATDVSITVRTPGGHSSIPSDHTSIGILAEIITTIESQQYPTFLAKDNPFYGFLQCGAEYSPDFPKKLKKLLGQRSEGKQTCAAKHKDKIAQEAAKISKESQYLMQTSQAVDLIKGGTKTNALPEAAVAVVNHRINIGQEPEDVWAHITHLIKPIAKKYNLTLNAFNGQSAGYKAISLSASDTTLRVAPITPSNVDTVNPFSVLSGTIRALYGEDTIVAPALMTGNTDTRYYWNLTKNIFRFGPGYVNEDETGVGNIHTVDESVTVSNHLKVVRWYNLFIRNFDEAVLEDD
ncbi:Carboxypeptidase S [Pseudocercospora fuligena]|uniref:Carboxypeptidase S n=1 Tax=Pseudocercospora fuligena TaxID=685502 RepID=A0A8H6VK09_9PEZI|nr:Carboxypeptidase S [Pseudocercospora fuligena]